MVWVPDAEGIIEHPIFNARESLASFEADGKTYKVPRTPFRLEGTPPRLDLSTPPLDVPQSEPLTPWPRSQASALPISPWAGPDRSQRASSPTWARRSSRSRPGATPTGGAPWTGPRTPL